MVRPEPVLAHHASGPPLVRFRHGHAVEERERPPRDDHLHRVHGPMVHRYTGPRELPVLQDSVDGRRGVGGGRGRPVPHLRGGLVRPRRDPRVDAGAAARRRGRRARGRSLPSGEGGEGCRPAARLGRGPGPSLSAVRRAAASRRLPAHGGSGLPVRQGAAGCSSPGAPRGPSPRASSSSATTRSCTNPSAPRWRKRSGAG